MSNNNKNGKLLWGKKYVRTIDPSGEEHYIVEFIVPVVFTNYCADSRDEARFAIRKMLVGLVVNINTIAIADCLGSPWVIVNLIVDKNHIEYFQKLLKK
jgi:hypothetical protein